MGMAALVAEDSFEFPLDAEGILCKVAARDLLEVSVQPLEAFWLRARSDLRLFTKE